MSSATPQVIPTPLWEVNTRQSSHRPATSGPRMMLMASVGLILAITVMRAWVCWGNDAWVNHPAGVLIAMASDLKQGVLYRPLYGTAGYGGTRYFPLYFVLHAAFMKLGMPVLLGAYLLSGAAMLALLAGTFYLLRTLGVAPWLAACCAGAVLAAGCAQYAVFSPHADGLAAALNIWGLAMIARPKRNPATILLSAALFALAWSAKLTTVFGFAAAFVWLLGTGMPRMAWLLAGETCGGYLAVAAAMFFGSQGRFWEIFKACASGGTSLMEAAAGPFNMVMVAARLDPVVLSFGCLALVPLAQVVLSGRFFRSLPALLFVATLAVTAFIYGTPGVNDNHLLDLQLASLLLIATQLTDTSAAMQKQWGAAILALLVLAAALPALRHFKNHDLRFHRHRFTQVLDVVGDLRRPILAENPIVPVLAGQQPYISDPWMLRLLRTRMAGFGDPLLDGLRNQKFGAVVLCMADPNTDFGRRWFETTHFGPGFASALTENYRLAAIVDDQKIYLPIERGAGQPAHATGTESKSQ
jgi:hypothetical protein